MYETVYVLYYYCSPEDLLYEFYTRTSAEIADMKRDRRQLEVEIPQATRGILVWNFETKNINGR